MSINNPKKKQHFLIFRRKKRRKYCENRGCIYKTLSTQISDVKPSQNLYIYILGTNPHFLILSSSPYSFSLLFPCRFTSSDTETKLSSRHRSRRHHRSVEMASLENDRPQSTSAARRKSKGKKKVSKTTGTQSQKYVEVGMRDALGRLVIAPAEPNGFFPSAESINGVVDSIKLFYHDAWRSWGEIPLSDREQMWNHFRTKFAWYPQYDYQIFCNFDMNASYMLNDTLGSAWKKNQKPDWMLEDIWARLNEKWTTENSKFQKTSIEAKTPGAFNNGDSLHIGGSEKKKGRTMTNEKQLKRKKDGYSTLVERTNVGHKKGLDELRQSQPASEDDSSKQSPDDDEASLLSKKIKKGKGDGVISPHCVGCMTYGYSSASLSDPHNEKQEEIDSLQRQVQELSKKQKADRLRLAGLEDLVRHLLEECRSEESDG